MKANRYRISIPLAVTVILWFASVSVAQQLPKAKLTELGISAEKLENLSTVLNSYVKDGRLAGSVAMVLRNGKVVYLNSFGYRDLESRSPMRTDSIFRIASQSKALTSVGIMIMQEEGKLLISDPLSKYLPEFANTTVAQPKDGGGYDIVKAKRAITIRDLLTHTSGISYGSGPAKDKWEAANITGWYFADRDEAISETVKRIAALPMDAQPGEKFIYGYSTDILGAVLEKVSGLPLDQFIFERITKPLKMTDTSFYLGTDKADRFTTVYSAKGSNIEKAPAPGLGVGQGAYLTGPKKSFSGGAGLLSTANDYARFLQMLLNNGELEGVRILSRKSVELMTADHLRKIPYDRDGVGFGLGFSIVKDVGASGTPSSVGEFGWGGAYHSNYWVDPKEKLVVVYFTQLIPAGNIDDFGKLRVLIYGSLID
ncbi:MAG TPA: serine hydrolase domain-containing protein [Pyrinomonadaceae bacterium]|nr:beta-lactamase family protein [Chloracidobacterium sp.]MBP9936777.1 beta-lactamase family protein [Pyrinomonadaceae bacterium]MBK9437568.1 beta-lactamase family protein [Chloracidobacterium sp.]MBL0240234.1 beta-lactamase family protein [Chloracidobacterium sp.]HQX56774.1 serine hydrolase domain-containing protein [Pyrinomonadaceae bacterium]